MYKYTHGGDIYSCDNTKLLDFSANINPLGLPKSVKEAIVENAENCDIYPDPLCRKLRRAISHLEEIPAENIYCGNGAADILFRLAISLKPEKALLAVPSFSEYEEALKSVGCKIEYHYMKNEDNFFLTEGFLGQISPDIDIVFLCNPNNPTGHLIEKGLLKRIIDKCYQVNTIVVIDECFIDFLPNSYEHTAKNGIFKYDNLIVLKAFTKMYAMAGVRLGYCLCNNADILDSLYRNGQPWNVSTIAQKAGIAATKEKDYVRNSIEIIEQQRQRLQQSLTNMGCQTYDSKANFIFFRYNSEHNLKEELLKNHILIRSCENYQRLNKEYYRIAVRMPTENDVIINSLKELRR